MTEVTNHEALEREVAKLAAYKAPNVKGAITSLERLRAIGFDVSGAEEALDEVGGVERGEYESSEEYKKDMSETWAIFLDAVRELEDEDDSDADELSQSEETDEQPAEEPATKTKSTKVAKPAQTGPVSYGTKELADLLKLDGRAVRIELRKVAKKDESPLLRVREGAGYSWSKRELEAVAKKIAKELDAE